MMAQAYQNAALYPDFYLIDDMIDEISFLEKEMPPKLFGPAYTRKLKSEKKAEAIKQANKEREKLEAWNKMRTEAMEYDPDKYIWAIRNLDSAEFGNYVTNINKFLKGEITMVQLNNTYDDASPTMGGGGFPLDEGFHPFIILSEEVKESKSNPQNKYLQYNCVVDDGVQKGVDFTIILNFWNSNPQAVEIAGSEFNTLRMACQVPGTNDSAQLIQKRAVAEVKRKSKGKNAGDLFIANYEPVAGAQPAAAPDASAPSANAAPPTTAPATTASAPPAQGNAAPWRKQ
jgi:hypothetical protein